MAQMLNHNKCRDAGLAAVLIVLLVSVANPQTWVILCAIALLFTAMAAPLAFWPFAWLWWRIAEVLGKAVSYMLLTAIFFGLVTPIAIFLRVAGTDPFSKKKFKKCKGSFFTCTSLQFSVRDLEKPY